MCDVNIELRCWCVDKQVRISDKIKRLSGRENTGRGWYSILRWHGSTREKIYESMLTALVFFVTRWEREAFFRDDRYNVTSMWGSNNDAMAQRSSTRRCYAMPVWCLNIFAFILSYSTLSKLCYWRICILNHIEVNQSSCQNGALSSKIELSELTTCQKELSELTTSCQK